MYRENSQSPVDDITAYGQYLASSLGKSSPPERDEPTEAPPLGQAMQVSKEQSPSGPTPPKQSPEENEKREEAPKLEKIAPKK